MQGPELVRSVLVFDLDLGFSRTAAYIEIDRSRERERDIYIVGK